LAPTPCLCRRRDPFHHRGNHQRSHRAVRPVCR
jgi:hypothetical protein